MTKKMNDFLQALYMDNEALMMIKDVELSSDAEGDSFLMDLAHRYHIDLTLDDIKSFAEVNEDELGDVSGGVPHMIATGFDVHTSTQLIKELKLQFNLSSATN